MKKILAAVTLVLSLGAFAYAAEPAKDAAAPGSPAVSTAATAPAAPGAPATMAAPAAMPGQPAAAPAPTAPVKVRVLKANRVITISMFLVIIGITLCVVVWAARQTKTTSDFYAAGGGITGTQNGWAIAGDYMSAASFLGISGMISLYGYDRSEEH